MVVQDDRRREHDAPRSRLSDQDRPGTIVRAGAHDLTQYVVWVEERDELSIVDGKERMRGHKRRTERHIPIGMGSSAKRRSIHHANGERPDAVADLEASKRNRSVEPFAPADDRTHDGGDEIVGRAGASITYRVSMSILAASGAAS